ncbi:velvet factor-domain-containing protein [Exophiala viscosa]|uniref:Velvet factor-domain-containing protein n=1 Tax=Exophiala viscosa TaxID=2486360 RepID=A0AAN6E024_9EURO|nr:velvet factor-domain-containing protein [Exophiala viscosa]KAI1619479.1 velvet factor-domain-containing protein [Exophiala viscosa]
MKRLPPISELSLTNPGEGSGEGSESRPPDRQPERSGSPGAHNLPGLRETVGAAYTAQRPLRPLPPPARPLYVPGDSQIYLDELPVRTYKVGGQLYNMAEPRNETRNEVSRLTVDNRRLTYILRVVQQPEKARACGAGAKSSTDRRPVDPPPVVRLQVYNGSTDVTMLYDSTFMLYASLEVARPISNGKMHNPTTLAVLSGVAVASAAYLERPEPAAYFIFPDLSVRHEGWYRLRFSLFEGVKHGCDADQDNPLPRQVPTLTPSDQLTGPNRAESMANRLEVQSEPFQVYSAKKFPGLNSSTDLSKHMSDQGCRVRIRRDIRQRKRPQKVEPEVEDTRSSYQGTPQVSYRTIDHSRSASRASYKSDIEMDAARRASVESIYGRPAIQSRQGSIASMPMASPLLSSMTPTTIMPPPSYHQPPMQRPYQEAPSSPAYMPAPAPKAHQAPPVMPSLPPPHMRPITPDHRNEFTLPPMLSTNGSSSGSFPAKNGFSGLYDLPASAPVKRTRSPHNYNMDTAMKAGARPDQLPMPAYSSTPLRGVDELIEADTTEDDAQDRNDADGTVRTELQYSMANGAMGSVRTLKPVYLPHRAPENYSQRVHENYSQRAPEDYSQRAPQNYPN